MELKFKKKYLQILTKKQLNELKIFIISLIKTNKLLIIGKKNIIFL